MKPSLKIWLGAWTLIAGNLLWLKKCKEVFQFIDVDQDRWLLRYRLRMLDCEQPHGVDAPVLKLNMPSKGLPRLYPRPNPERVAPDNF
jgi:hypothetical protein